MDLLINGCSEKCLKDIPSNSVDSIVTDPPYGISFMNKHWDYDVPKVEVWSECLRVLKPGGHILVACGTRTQHRMAVNIEDAGFEIRDIVSWLYGSGFPKSLDVSKAIDKAAGVYVPGESLQSTRKTPASQTNIATSFREKTATNPQSDAAKQWQGWGTALKPAQELWTLARKPLSEKTVAANVLKWGTGGINIDGSRVDYSANENIDFSRVQDGNIYGKADQKQTTALFKANGRFPANLILDEQAAAALDKQTDSQCSRFFYTAKASKSERNAGLEGMPTKKEGIGDERPSGQSMQRLDGREAREMQNFHPTVKPIKLMEYLIKLITPPNGVVLDPYMGSGSTGIAAKKLGFGFIGIERESEYVEIAKKRINGLWGGLFSDNSLPTP
jgi:site-specific DNA-methyltransferase (adenine-specific)